MQMTLAEKFTLQPMKDVDALRENLVHFMKRMKWSQTKLGKAAGIAQTTVSAIKRGKVSPQLDTLGNMARALGVSTWELITPPEARELLRAFQAASSADRISLLRYAQLLAQSQQDDP